MHPSPVPSPDNVPNLISNCKDMPDTDIDKLMSLGDERITPPLPVTGLNCYQHHPCRYADDLARHEACTIAANPRCCMRHVSIFRTEAPTLVLHLTEREELDNLLNVKLSLWLPNEQKYVQDLTHKLLDAANGLVEEHATIAFGSAGNMVGVEVD